MGIPKLEEHDIKIQGKIKLASANTKFIDVKGVLWFIERISTSYKFSITKKKIAILLTLKHPISVNEFIERGFRILEPRRIPP